MSQSEIDERRRLSNPFSKNSRNHARVSRRNSAQEMKGSYVAAGVPRLLSEIMKSNFSGSEAGDINPLSHDDNIKAIEKELDLENQD